MSKYVFDNELLVAAENTTSEEGEKFMDALDAMADDPSAENEEKLRIVRIAFVDYLISVEAIDAENRSDYLLDEEEGDEFMGIEVKEAIDRGNRIFAALDNDIAPELDMDD